MYLRNRGWLDDDQRDPRKKLYSEPELLEDRTLQQAANTSDRRNFTGPPHTLQQRNDIAVRRTALDYKDSTTFFEPPPDEDRPKIAKVKGSRHGYDAMIPKEVFIQQHLSDPYSVRAEKGKVVFRMYPGPMIKRPTSGWSGNMQDDFFKSMNDQAGGPNGAPPDVQKRIGKLWLK